MMNRLSADAGGRRPRSLCGLPPEVWTGIVRLDRLGSALEEGGLAMKRSQYTDQQVAFALQQAETGTAVPKVSRKMGISEATYYRWKQKYGGLMPSEVQRLRHLEEESRGGNGRGGPADFRLLTGLASLSEKSTKYPA